MSKIDWGKAPEGALWHIDNDGFEWYRVSNGRLQYYADKSKTWWDSGYSSIEQISDAHEVTPRLNFQPFTSIEDAQTEGLKLDSGKAIIGAIPPDAELAIARVLTFGAEKYARDNWRKVPDIDVRYMDAALRHLNAHRRGEQVDAESGESHLAHAACCIMFLLQIKEEQK